VGGRGEVTFAPNSSNHLDPVNVIAATSRRARIRSPGKHLWVARTVPEYPAPPGFPGKELQNLRSKPTTLE